MSDAACWEQRAYFFAAWTIRGSAMQAMAVLSGFRWSWIKNAMHVFSDLALKLLLEAQLCELILDMLELNFVMYQEHAGEKYISPLQQQP